MLKLPRTRLYIVRHGATSFNLENRLAGVTDVPLSEEGRAQIAALRPELDRRPIDFAFTSTLKRARETCRILVDGRDMAVRITPGLIERDFGEWEGRTFEQIISEQPDGGRSLLYGPFVAKFLSGESDSVFFERVRRTFFEEILIKGEHRNVLVVGHAGFLMVMLAVALGMNPVKDFATFRLENGSLTILDWYDGVPHLHFVNRIFTAPK
jgi:broad specificity phosphatase PhoE